MAGFVNVKSPICIVKFILKEKKKYEWMGIKYMYMDKNERVKFSMGFQIQFLENIFIDFFFFHILRYLVGCLDVVKII